MTTKAVCHRQAHVMKDGSPVPVPDVFCTSDAGHIGDCSWKRDQLNAMVKEKFAIGLDSHVRTCAACLVFGPDRCEVGAILKRCAEHGLDVQPKAVG